MHVFALYKYFKLLLLLLLVVVIVVVVDGQDGDGLHVETFSLDFSKFSYPSLGQKQMRSMDYSSIKKIDILVLNFKAMFLLQEKVRKRDFSIFFGQKTAKVP